MRLRPYLRPMNEVRSWLLLGLIAMACEPRLLLGELVEATGGVAGTGGTGAAAAAPALIGGDAQGGEGPAGAPQGGAGDHAAGAPNTCSASDGGAPGMFEGGGYNDGPLPAPWQTSFEDGLCSYKLDAGFCYSFGGADHRIVSSPVRTGQLAAAFDIGLDGPSGSQHTRCVREGQLPTEAYYGAWYYLPEAATATDNWNLFHFRGRESGQPLHGLWDVSLTVVQGVGLAAYVREMLANRIHEQETPVAIPIGRWFQLEFYLKRAADTTGEVALFQDGVEIVRVSQVRTDDTDFGQWYVGNYADDLTPSRYTLYVDDVTIRLGP